MKKLVAVLFVLAAALLIYPINAMSKQSYDFSDVEQPFLTLPFEVISVDVSGQAPEVHHNYHLAESYDKVIDKLVQMYEKKTPISNYFVIGVTKQSNTQMHQVILAYQNEHHYVQVTPEGSGTLFSLQAVPVSYVTGVFPIAAYGFTMPDGGMVSVDKRTEE